jgi:hypothetical protein
MARSFQEISETSGGFRGVEIEGSHFGISAASLGDLDGDGVVDVAVGAPANDQHDEKGAAWILFLHRNGTVKSHQEISSYEGGFTGVLDVFDRFGSSIASVGDLDGDGTIDLAVGAPGDDDGGTYSLGAVWILFLHRNGTVKSHQKISMTAGGYRGTGQSFAQFGSSVAWMGGDDANGTNVLAVGAWGDRDGMGAIWLLSLHANGTVERQQEISHLNGNFTGTLGGPWKGFGSSVTSIGDLDVDGVVDLAVGTNGDHDPEKYRGSVWILFLDGRGMVKRHQKIRAGMGGFTGRRTSFFGTSVCGIGDMNGDGITDLAVGDTGDGDGGELFGNKGAIWVLFLDRAGTVKFHQKIDDEAGNFNGALREGDSFGRSIASIGDVDGDGASDLAVGAGYSSPHGGDGADAMWILFMD